MVELQKRLSLRRVAIILGTAAAIGTLVWPLVCPRLIRPRTAASAYRHAANAQVVAEGFPYAPLANAAELDRAAESLIASEASRRIESSDPAD
jgi:hypothetical protein